MRSGLSLAHAAPWSLFSPDLGLASIRGATMPSTKTAVVAIGYTTSAATFPDGSVVDHIVVTCLAATPSNSQVSQSVPAGTATVTFGPLSPDTYTISAQAFPATGPAWAPAVSTTITITAPVLVSLSLPSSLAATQP